MLVAWLVIAVNTVVVLMMCSFGKRSSPKVLAPEQHRLTEGNVKLVGMLADHGVQQRHEKVEEIPSDVPIGQFVEDDDTLRLVDSLTMESETDFLRTTHSILMLTEAERSIASSESEVEPI